MLKLKKNVRNFLKANVKPEYLDRVILFLEHNADDFIEKGLFAWDVPYYQFIHGVDFRIHLTKDDFEELKPYKWYPKDWYDGNPRGYLIVEHRGYGAAVEECDYNGSLDCDTECFMYVERPKDLVTIRHQREMEYENN